MGRLIHSKRARVVLALLAFACGLLPSKTFGDPTTTDPNAGFESFGAPGLGIDPNLLGALPGLPGSGGDDGGSLPAGSTQPGSGFDSGTGFDPSTGFGSPSGFGSRSQSRFGSGISAGLDGVDGQASAASADGRFDGIRKSDTVNERSRAAEFIRIQMFEIFNRTTNKDVFKSKYHEQNIVSLALIRDDAEGLLFFNGIMDAILFRGAADFENEATLLDLRNQLYKIGDHLPVNGKGDNYVDATDLSPQDRQVLDLTVVYLDELIDKEQERKERQAEKEAEREARKAAKNNAGGGGGAGSSTPPSPLSLPPSPPGQPPQPIKQPQHSPDPSFVENTNRFLQEAARSFSDLSGLFPQKQDDVVETLGGILKTIPKPPTKFTAPVDTAGILGLQQRELAGLVGSAIQPLPTLFPQDPGVSFMARIQAFAQGNFSRVSVTTLPNSRSSTPTRFPASPVGAAGLVPQSLFSRTAVTGPRLGAVPDFQELFGFKSMERQPAGTRDGSPRAVSQSSDVKAEPLSRRRSIQRPLTHK